MQAIGRQPQRAPDGAPIHYERHRPEQTTLYCLVQQHGASFIAHTEASTGSALPRFIKDEWWNGVAATSQAIWVVGDGGRVMTSNDDGQTWRSQPSGTQENLYAVSFADAQNGAAVGRRGTVIVTADGGAHWTGRPLGLDTYLGAVHVDASTIWIAGEGGLVASSPR